MDSHMFGGSSIRKERSFFYIEDFVQPFPHPPPTSYHTFLLLPFSNLRPKMFFPSTAFLIFPLLGFALAAPSLRLRQDATGTISSPPNGASINPGASFDFLYNSRADYGITSLNYTVFLFTSSPISLVPSAEFATGHFFGRFAEPNYPGEYCTRSICPFFKSYPISY